MVKDSRRQGRLPEGLVTRSELIGAIEEAVARSSRYWMVIRRSKTDWATGEPRPPRLFIHDGADHEPLSQLLRNARNVTLQLWHSDDGILRIELPRRTWLLENPSDSATETVQTLQKRFKDNRPLKDFTPGVLGVLVMAAPWLVAIFARSTALVVDPRYRQVEDRELERNDPDYYIPLWLDFILGNARLAIFPMLFLGVLILGIGWIAQGPLKAYPDRLTVHSLRVAFARFLNNIPSWKQRDVGLVLLGAVVTTFLGWVFLRT